MIAVNTIAHFSLTRKHFSRIMIGEPMRIARRVLMLLAPLAGVAVATSSLLSGAATHMAVSEIRPGMIGVGRTVFDGTHVEEFKVNVIGVLENVIGTHRSLILAKLEGGPLANTGVIAGMSGSPVYVDGRLIGAVSYALGSFSKEPIAGITPIEEMVDATSAPAVRPATARAVGAPMMRWPPTQEDYVAALRDAFARLNPFGGPLSSSAGSAS